MKFVPPRIARELLGVHRNTLSAWEKQGRLPNTRRLRDGHRRYALADLAKCMVDA